MTLKSVKSEQNPGAVHADLVAAAGALRFRPERLSADDFKHEVTCRFRLDDASVGPLRVLDASPTGVGVEPSGKEFMAPGAHLDGLEILYRGAVAWTGSATAVYQTDEPRPRIGLRFTSGLFDTQRLRVSDSLIGDQIEQELTLQQRYLDRLPSDYRATVGAVRQLLETARAVLHAAEEMLGEGGAPDPKTVVETLYAQWGPRYGALLTSLHEGSRELDGEGVELARNFATRELLPLLHPCPMHSRAYDKPLGYAGDFELMTYYFDDELTWGKSLYAKFLQYVAQHYELGYTVRAREESIREAVKDTLSRIDRDDPARIVSLACGPAIEVQNLVSELKPSSSPIEYFLIDQDKEALQHCHEHLTRDLIGRHRGRLPISLHYLHFSVRQLLKPTTDAELHVVQNVLKDADLIYSAGLLDYLPAPVAMKLLARLWSMIRPGGRLFIGNLREAKDTTWVMEFVLSWHLVYRTPDSMMALVSQLEPAPKNVRIVFDATELCMFLEIERPE